MNSPTDSCVRGLIDAHFSGSISPRRERALRVHLPGCASCRGYYERHLLLTKIDPSAPSAEERIAAGLGLGRRPRAAPMWSMAMAFCAVCAVMAFLPVRPRNATPAFGSRGAPIAATPWLSVYRTDPTARPVTKGEALDQGATIRPDDELAFAYANPSAFARLLVYGVDEHRHVYWYYPAWSNPADDPHAVPLGAGPEMRELPEAIRHDLDGREITIVAIFLRDDDDLTVKRVEHLLGEGRAAGEAPWARGSHEQRLTLHVER